MKEASGEANMTIVTVVLIGIVLGFGTLIVKNLLTNTQKSAECQAQGMCAGENGCVACPTN